MDRVNVFLACSVVIFLMCSKTYYKPCSVNHNQLPSSQLSKHLTQDLDGSIDFNKAIKDLIKDLDGSIAFNTHIASRLMFSWYVISSYS